MYIYSIKSEELLNFHMHINFCFLFILRAQAGSHRIRPAATGTTDGGSAQSANDGINPSPGKAFNR